MLCLNLLFILTIEFIIHLNNLRYADDTMLMADIDRNELEFRAEAVQRGINF